MYNKCPSYFCDAQRDNMQNKDHCMAVWAFECVLPRVLASQLMACCQGQQSVPCRADFIVAKFWGWHLCSFRFFTFPGSTTLNGVALCRTFTNHASVIHCSQVRKRCLNASIIRVSSLINQWDLEYRAHHLNLFLTEQIPAGTQHDQHGGVWERQRLIAHQTVTMGNKVLRPMLDCFFSRMLYVSLSMSYVQWKTEKVFFGGWEWTLPREATLQNVVPRLNEEEHVITSEQSDSYVGALEMVLGWFVPVLNAHCCF